MSPQVGGWIDKSLCFLPLWWAKLVFLLLLCMLKDMCEGNLCQFWPPSGDSLSRRDFSKSIPLTTPLTKIFFEYIQICLFLSTGWCTAIPNGQDSILEGLATLQNHFWEIGYFQKISKIAFLGEKLFWGGQKTITEDNHDWVMIGSPCLSVGDKITCFHPLEHFLNHIQSFKAH